MFGEWEIKKNLIISSIAYEDIVELYIDSKSIVTAQANFTTVTGKSVVLPMIAQADFNAGMALQSVRISLDTYKLGKAM